MKNLYQSTEIQQVNQVVNLKRIPAVHFIFDLWSAGSFTELGIKGKLREFNIDGWKSLVIKYAVGYTDGEKLNVRPKKNCKAVMFFINNKHFWSHLTNNEFKIFLK